MSSHYNGSGIHRTAIVSEEPELVRLRYVDAKPPSGTESRGVIVLIHGFPQTSYQFRHVIKPLSQAGYRIIAPDFRGAGDSSKPVNLNGYRKVVMADGIRKLLRDHLNIEEKIHVVGHDIGGMIAHAFAASFPENTASITWGECPLPGTKYYDEIKATSAVWHFLFHRQIDLPEALTAGKERHYLKHFFDKQAYNVAAITPEDLDHYAKQYAAPGGMRCGFNSYRLFETDAADNKNIREEKGKCKVPCMVLSGSESFLAPSKGEEASEFYETYNVAQVENSGHWIAEENPEGFVREITNFVSKM